MSSFLYLFLPCDIFLCNRFSFLSAEQRERKVTVWMCHSSIPSAALFLWQDWQVGWTRGSRNTGLSATATYTFFMCASITKPTTTFWLGASILNSCLHFEKYKKYSFIKKAEMRRIRLVLTHPSTLFSNINGYSERIECVMCA